ncbi:MAG: response regulator transcription factor [Candidatus Dormibacteria bacterium]
MSHASRLRGRAGDAVQTLSVLVVSNDVGLRDQVAAWVEEAGYDVVVCSGPQLPGHGCIGLNGLHCPLLAGADLAVLDLHPMASNLTDQSGRAALVELYRTGGRPVLVLADELSSEPQLEAVGAAILERTADRGDVLWSISELLRPQG